MFTTKHASNSSTVQGGGKRRTVIAALDARPATTPLSHRREQQHRVQWCKLRLRKAVACVEMIFLGLD